MEVADESLRQQFQYLQEQQQKKLLRRKQKKEEKERSSAAAGNISRASAAFGVTDNLDLKLAEAPVNTKGSYLSEELVDHLNDQIRELKDENGRVYKLLSERDFELRQLKKKVEDEKIARATAGGPVTNETAGLKIIELSKKVRDLTAELESERTKCKQLSRKCHDAQVQLNKMSADNRSQGSAHTQKSQAFDEDEKVDDQESVKSVQDKLKQAELKVSDYRNQCQTLRQELKMAQKVLNQEVGENVNIQACLNSTGNWRGRAQQILALQKKVDDLRYELDTVKNQDNNTGDLEQEMLGAPSARRRTAVEKQREQTRRIEKERKETQEKQQNELKALEEEVTSLKQKLDAAKSRNKVLSNDMKSNKQQMQTLIQKGQHDDELIEAMMKQQAQLREMLDEATKAQKESLLKQTQQMNELNAKSQQENNVVEQLKAIVAEKETKVKILEKEIHQLKMAHLQRAQMQGVTTLFHQREHQGSTQSSRPSTAGNEPVDVGFTVESVTPPHSRLSERPVSAEQSAQVSAVNQDSVPSRGPSRRSAMKSAMSEIGGQDKQVMSELQYQCQELKTVAQVAQVERDKLMELVKVLQNRVDEASSKLTESQNELVQQRRKNVLLEKQIGKAKIDTNRGPLSARRKQTGKSNVSASITSLQQTNEEEDLNNFSMEELKTNLEIQKDENEALKAALQSTLKAKEEDMRMYSTMIEDTKTVFLQALRQYKQNVQGT